MWLFLSVLSALLLGLYDVAKKQALKKNGVLAVLLVATALSTLFVSPFFRLGPAADHLRLALKAVLVSASWISGMAGLKLLPLTTVSTIKGSRPVFVVLFSVILFGEHLSWVQWLGVALVLGALYMLGFSSRGDTSVQARKSGFVYMGISVVTGVASALYDKRIMGAMEPLFVQSWTNLYITIILALCIFIKRYIKRYSRTGAIETDRGRSWPREWEGPEGAIRHPAGSGIWLEPNTEREQGRREFSGGRAPSESMGGMSEAKSDATAPVREEQTEIQAFRWDWTLLLVAVLITGADACYFFALKQPDALLSIISVIRRASVLVTFVCGALLFREGNLRAKAANMALMASGVVLLLLGI